MSVTTFFQRGSALRSKPLFAFLCVTFAVATVSFLTHALEKNPQYDSQGIRYGQELTNAITSGHFMDWINESPPRKYPTLYIVPFSIAYEIAALGYERGRYDLPYSVIHLTARLVSLLYTLCTIALVVAVSRKLRLHYDDVLLLLFSSVLFFLYATAVRPHGAVMFWTILTYYASLQLQEKKSLRRMIAAFGAAACAFATLQSGLFAFVFPVWAVLAGKRSARHIALGVCCGIMFVGLGALVGYPFLLHGVLHTQNGSIDTSLGHDLGFKLLLENVPVKAMGVFSAEPLLCIFGIIGMVQVLRNKHPWRHPLFPVVCYIILFCAVFLGHYATASRYFVPMLPLLALLGAPLLVRYHKLIRPALAVFLILLYLQFTRLGLRPDTFQQASALLENKGGLVATSLPGYFFPLPFTRFAQSKDQLKDVLYILAGEEQDVSRERDFPDFSVCATIRSSRYARYFSENSSPFLWNAVEWPGIFAFEVTALGPNIILYCR